MGVGNILSSATADKQDTKWDRFNNDAHEFFEDLMKRGLIVGYEVRNYVPGKMNCFFMFEASDLRHSPLKHRGVCLSFNDRWKEYGITDEDMRNDCKMGLVSTTEYAFEKVEKRVQSWTEVSCEDIDSKIKSCLTFLMNIGPDMYTRAFWLCSLWMYMAAKKSGTGIVSKHATADVYNDFVYAYRQSYVHNESLDVLIEDLRNMVDSITDDMISYAEIDSSVKDIQDYLALAGGAV